MKVIVNLPDDMQELEDKLAEFHATLVKEKIKQLNICDISKQKILSSILDELKEKCTGN